jgi:hypothetical protein
MTQMAKQRLFPESPDDQREPHERFEALAAKVIAVPKSEIDDREKRWRKRRRSSARRAKR